MGFRSTLPALWRLSYLPVGACRGNTGRKLGIPWHCFGRTACRAYSTGSDGARPPPSASTEKDPCKAREGGNTHAPLPPPNWPSSLRMPDSRPALDRAWAERIQAIKNALWRHDTQKALRSAAKVLNDITEYSSVERLKQQVIQQEREFQVTRQRLVSAKRAYEDAIARRSATQREINELLQRKHAWTNDDVTRFTTLYREEHDNEQAESKARDEFHRYEKQVEREYTELTRAIMVRYHEEQVWSDKIRSASTYVTIALMLVNVALFVCVQTVFEPRKRQKLANRFEELLAQKSAEDSGRLATSVKPIVEAVRREESKIDQVLTAQGTLLNRGEVFESSSGREEADGKQSAPVVTSGGGFWTYATAGMFGGAIVAFVTAAISEH